MESNENAPSTGKRLAGKVAWVTGSSRGIGRVVADHLAALGAKVAIHGTAPHSTRAFNEADSLQAVADAIAEGHNAEVLAVQPRAGGHRLRDRAASRACLHGNAVLQTARRLGRRHVPCAYGRINMPVNLLDCWRAG